MGRDPPPLAPPGGVYTTKNYCGPITWGVSIFGTAGGCPCFLWSWMAPCDAREVYLTQDNLQYNPRTGKMYRKACGRVYCCYHCACCEGKRSDADEFKYRGSRRASRVS